MTRQTFTPCCLVCYTTNLTPKPVGKREAERVAVSHQNMYRHDVTLLATDLPKVPCATCGALVAVPEVLVRTTGYLRCAAGHSFKFSRPQEQVA